MRPAWRTGWLNNEPPDRPKANAAARQGKGCLMSTHLSAQASHRANVLRQYYVLTKPRVVQLIVFCAFIGMVLAVPGVPTWPDVLQAAQACVGIWLVAAAAAAFNCLVEKGIDAKMKRTAWRPTARGELSDLQALVFSAVLCAAGSAVLWFTVNPLTMWLTFAPSSAMQ
jgi:heme o synthase